MREWIDLFESESPTQLARKIAEELMSESGLTAQQFNNGRCMEFSDELERRDDRFHSFELGNFYNHDYDEGEDAEDATGFSQQYLKPYPEWVPPQGLSWQDLFDHYGFNWSGLHMWAWCSENRLCYDIEAPDGVRNLFDLPFFQRQIAHGPN